MMFLQASALAALVASVSGHIIMGSPVPFDWEDSATMQSPLVEAANFPCKQPSGKYAYTTMNTYKAGDSMEVKLIGGATHGGGSCQFSITTDTKPTKDSQWKVLFSQIGGCPGGPPDNNKSGDKNDQGNAPFSVPIPKDLPSGQYTMAWTWNNKMGNREFYMNCAPIEITGGSGDVSKVLGDLPDMFVINLPETECQLVANQDALYPNPGKAVATAAAATPGLKIEGSGCGTQTKLGAGAGKLGTPSQATGAPASGSSSAAASKPTTSAVGSSSAAASKPTSSAAAGGVFAPSAASSVAAEPTASQPATAQPTGSTSTPATGGSTCSTNGALVCIGSSQFGICDNGVAVAQALAAGTKCSNGAISARSVPRGYMARFFN